jgi:hypothetical protein
MYLGPEDAEIGTLNFEHCSFVNVSTSNNGGVLFSFDDSSKSMSFSYCRFV